MESSQIIYQFSCPDQVGIVAKLTTIIAKHQANLEELRQFVDPVSKQLFARAKITVDQTKGNAEALIKAVEKVGAALGVKAKWVNPSRLVKTSVLVSKQNHCLVEILAKLKLGMLPIQVTSIISNHKNCQHLAEEAGIPYIYLPMDKDSLKASSYATLEKIWRQQEVELIVLARFMQIIPDDLCEFYKGNIINIHHSLLPAFLGVSPYKRAYERGVKWIGATCHYVTSDLDAGPIIEQEVTRIEHFHTPKDLMRLGSDCERRALSQGVSYHLEGRTLIDGKRVVVFPD